MTVAWTDFRTPKLCTFFINHKLEFCIVLERKCVREDAGVGFNTMKLFSYSIFIDIAYACILSDTFALQEHIIRYTLIKFNSKACTLKKIKPVC